ncbi:FkbM family methyltransferase [Sphingorhabdus sp. Alg231-15]|uniref:FkbM family methyltransferase n=1 Tax=Sphingorhabdus sp. Alg231-15 TaxID=1922222 RepID=UPI000D554ED0
MLRYILSAGQRAAIKSKFHSLLMRHPPLETRCVQRAIKMDLHTVIDVGANHGQFASRVRALGWRGKILSFEPLLEPFESLHRLTTKDPSHEAFQFGLGEENTEPVMNVASNHGASSSLLEFEPLLKDSFSITSISQEKVSIRRLDDVAKELDLVPEKCLLKIDTQGFEKQVLEGSGEILDQIQMLFLEVSLRPVYKDEPRLFEMLSFLDSRGFEVRDLEPSVFDSPFRPYQCDILCLRKGVD